MDIGAFGHSDPSGTGLKVISRRAGDGGGDGAQPLGSDVGRDLGRPDVGVPEERLDNAQVGAAAEEMGGERVPQRVRRDVRVDRCRACPRAAQLPDGLA